MSFIFKSYLSLNTRDIEAIIDEQLQYTILHKAAKLGFDSFILRMLTDNENKGINFPSQNGNTPLHIAALFGHYEAIKVLCDCGADCDLVNKDKKLPLMLACSLSNVNSKEEKLPSIRFLIEQTKPHVLKKVDNVLGYSVLIALIPYNNVDTVNVLFKQMPRFARH